MGIKFKQCRYDKQQKNPDLLAVCGELIILHRLICVEEKMLCLIKTRAKSCRHGFSTGKRGQGMHLHPE